MYAEKDVGGKNGVSIPAKWHNKRYYSLEAWLKNTYGHRLEKISIDAGFTCPNRDGTLGTGGCIFCSEGGSGDFALSPSSVHATRPYIAYFQAYTGTYAPSGHLEQLYGNALSDPLVAGISIATRPDCLDSGIITLLENLSQRYPDKFLWIELGLQTIHENTARYIRRGYKLDCFERAMHALHRAKIPVIVHVILGLPGETEEQMLQTIRYLNRFPPFGIKLQLLHVLRGTDLCRDYEAGFFEALSMEEYLHILRRCIEQLDPGVVIHRVTGDGPKELLVAPLWSADKRKVLNTLHHQLKQYGSLQGKDLKGGLPHGAGISDII